MTLPNDENDRWSLYRETLARAVNPTAVSATDDGVGYLPSPAEIDERVLVLIELQSYGFGDRFISSIMKHSTPTLATVRRMVARHGAGLAFEKCVKFLADTEYDKPGDRDL